jgi:hypothetical protein
MLSRVQRAVRSPNGMFYSATRATLKKVADAIHRNASSAIQPRCCQCSPNKPCRASIKDGPCFGSEQLLSSSSQPRPLRQPLFVQICTQPRPHSAKMKSTSIFAAIASMLSLGIHSASAKCFGDGASWPNKEEARSFAYDACHNNGGMFTGNYAPLQLKAMCPTSGNMGVEFVVQDQNKEVGFDLGDDDCSERLNNEIFGCEHGGESVVAGWYFR